MSPFVRVSTRLSMLLIFFLIAQTVSKASLYLNLFFFQVTDGVCRVGPLLPSAKAKAVFGVVLMFIQFFGPVVVLIICYGKIVWILTKRINTDSMENISAMDNTEDFTVNTRVMSPASDPGMGKFQLARRNTIKTVLIVGLCFIVCWSQNEIMYVMYNCGYDIDFNTVYFQFTVLMVFLNCTVNPFIYLIEYRDYQEALKYLFHCNKDQ